MKTKVQSRHSTSTTILDCSEEQRKVLPMTCSSKFNGSLQLLNLIDFRSPDGSSLLASTTGNKLDVYILYNLILALLILSPHDILEPIQLSDEYPHRILSPYVSVHECEPTNSSQWYPGMNLQAPETCCFVSGTADQPIHLWDSLTGKVQLSKLSLTEVARLIPLDRPSRTISLTPCHDVLQ